MTTATPNQQSTTLIDHQWIHTDQAVECMKVIKERNENQLKDFSLLFNPTPPPGLIQKQYRYKILLVGETGCGKTSLVRALMGKEFSTLQTQPTLGIQVKSIYWPVKVNQPSQPVYLLRLDFWDVGHTSSARFDYIDKDSSELLDMIIFVVSATNRESFNQLPELIQEYTNRSFSMLVIITKYDHLAELTEDDAQEFQAKYRIPVYLFSSVDANMRLSATYLNIIAEKLHRRDLESSQTARP